MNKSKECPSHLSWQEYWVSEYKKQLANHTLKPTYVQWICSYRCNFSCPHCGTAAGQAREDELSTQDIFKTIDILADLGCEMFSITGGEPLMREDIFDVITYANEKEIKAGFVTNGYLVEEYIKQLQKVKLTSVLVSIDGYQENQAKIRGMPYSYKRCLRSVNILKNLGVDIVGVSTVMLDENIDDIPNIFEDAFKYGATKARIQPLVPEGRAKGRTNYPQTVKKALRMILTLRSHGLEVEMSEGFGYLGRLEPYVRPYRFFCGCGWNTFTIMHNGNIMGCPALDFPQLGEGNLKDTDLDKIWWKKFKRFRVTLFDELPSKCKKCEYVKICRGGCWLFRANNADPCFLEEAEEIAEEILNK